MPLAKTVKRNKHLDKLRLVSTDIATYFQPKHGLKFQKVWIEDETNNHYELYTHLVHNTRINVYKLQRRITNITS